MPSYTPPLRDMQFLMHEVFRITEDYRQMPDFAEVDVDTINAVLAEAGKFAAEVVQPLNMVGDEQGCTLDQGTHEVTTPEGFKQAYRQYVEGGWPALSCAPEYGGQGLPVGPVDGNVDLGPGLLDVGGGPSDPAQDLVACAHCTSPSRFCFHHWRNDCVGGASVSRASSQREAMGMGIGPSHLPLNTRPARRLPAWTVSRCDPSAMTQPAPFMIACSPVGCFDVL